MSRLDFKLTGRRQMRIDDAGVRLYVEKSAVVQEDLSALIWVIATKKDLEALKLDLDYLTRTVAPPPPCKQL